MKNLAIRFRTLENGEIRHIDLNSFNLSCKTPVKVLDINEDLSGDVTSKFIDYTQQINRNLIGKAFRNNIFLRGVPENGLDTISRYPETTICTDRSVSYIFSLLPEPRALFQIFVSFGVKNYF
jgi:hypothetical protein